MQVEGSLIESQQVENNNCQKLRSKYLIGDYANRFIFKVEVNLKHLLIMKIQKKLVFIYACSLFLVSGCYYRNEEDLYPESSSCDTNNVTYSASVAPVFATYCN